MTTGLLKLLKNSAHFLTVTVSLKLMLRARHQKMAILALLHWHALSCQVRSSVLRTTTQLGLDTNPWTQRLDTSCFINYPFHPHNELSGVEMLDHGWEIAGQCAAWGLGFCREWDTSRLPPVSEVSQLTQFWVYLGGNGHFLLSQQPVHLSYFFIRSGSRCI